MPYLKQTCLVEYLKEKWPTVLSSKAMSSYQYFCLYYPQRLYYNLIIFGSETPASRCCRQLLIFQFTLTLPQTPPSLQQDSTIPSNHTTSAQLSVICSDQQCSETPLLTRAITERSFIESILLTPNGAQLTPNPRTSQKDRSVLSADTNRIQFRGS